ncbi:MAG: hypothetical protein MK089_05120, partial [Phycisphaerales bacterium]|nr:hypothetical protein [Phycisphaerales bacterium]
MIDLKQLRESPERFIQGAEAKNIDVDIDRLLELDQQRRDLLQKQETLRAEQKKIGKETGPQIGKLKGQLKSVEDSQRAELEARISELEARPAALKQ